MQISDTGGGPVGQTYLAPPRGNPGGAPVQYSPGTVGQGSYQVGAPAQAQPTPGGPPQPTYFNPGASQQQQQFFNAPTTATTTTQAQPASQAPVSSTPQATNATPTAGATSSGTVAAPTANSSLWSGAPNYESQLYANMYSGNPGGVPSSLAMQQLNQGNPAQGVGQSYLPSYFQGNLSGRPTQDTAQVNTGMQQAILLSMHANPQTMSYFRGAGG